jgi:hypothetical protein
MFASKAGQLAGNHFATIVEGLDRLRELGPRVLWEGAKEVLIEEEESEPSASPTRLEDAATALATGRSNTP